MPSLRRRSGTTGPRRFTTLHGPEIIAKLKSRRDLLPDVAAKYANVVAHIVEVRGTKKNEKFVHGAPAQRQHPPHGAQNQQEGQAGANGVRPHAGVRHDRRAAAVRHQRQGRVRAEGQGPQGHQNPAGGRHRPRLDYRQQQRDGHAPQGAGVRRRHGQRHQGRARHAPAPGAGRGREPLRPPQALRPQRTTA